MCHKKSKNAIFVHYKTHYMKVAPVILPKNLRILVELGEHIQLARLRRKFSAEQVAERAGISRKTVYNIEQGVPTVAIGSYLQVLFVLGLEKDLAAVAANDPLGRKLQDAGIAVAKRAPKKQNKP
jgi:DNA-binding XRE family transcriptional regulator